MFLFVIFINVGRNVTHISIRLETCDKSLFVPRRVTSFGFSMQYPLPGYTVMALRILIHDADTSVKPIRSIKARINQRDVAESVIKYLKSRGNILRKMWCHTRLRKSKWRTMASKQSARRVNLSPLVNRRLSSLVNERCVIALSKHCGPSRWSNLPSCVACFPVCFSTFRASEWHVYRGRRVSVLYRFSRVIQIIRRSSKSQSNSRRCCVT